MTSLIGIEWSLVGQPEPRTRIFAAFVKEIRCISMPQTCSYVSKQQAAKSFINIYNKFDQY